MGTAAVVATGVTLAVVVAADIGVIVQVACQECFHSVIGIAGNAAVELDACLSQSHLCAAANTAADQNVNAAAEQETCQSAMAGAVGIHDLGGDDGAVFNVVNLELLGVAEVLVNQFVCVSNYDFHGVKNSFFFVVKSIIVSFLKM